MILLCMYGDRREYDEQKPPAWWEKALATIGWIVFLCIGFGWLAKWLRG